VAGIKRGGIGIGAPEITAPTAEKLEVNERKH